MNSDEKYLTDFDKITSEEFKYKRENRDLKIKFFKLLGIGLSCLGILLFGIFTIINCNQNAAEQKEQERIGATVAFEKCLQKLDTEICSNMNQICISRETRNEMRYTNSGLKLARRNFQKCTLAIGIDDCHLIAVAFRTNFCLGDD